MVITSTIGNRVVRKTGHVGSNPTNSAKHQCAENTSNQRVFGTFYGLNYFISFDEIRYFFNIMSVKIYCYFKDAKTQKQIRIFNYSR